MKGYNLYFGTTRLTKMPISKKMKDKIYSMEYVYKQEGNNKIKIPVNKLRSVECIIV